MMGSAGLFLCSGFGCADAELAMHRDRIAIHDLAMKTGCEFQRESSFAAGCRANNHNQQGIARQLACAPMDVMPVAGDSKGENKNHYDDEAEIFQPFLTCRAGLIACSSMIAMFGHGTILAKAASYGSARRRKMTISTRRVRSPPSTLWLSETG